MYLAFFWSSIVGALGFCFLLLPLGFLLGYGTNVARFRTLPGSTQVVWSVLLGTPLGVLFPVLLEYWLPVPVVAWLLVAVALVGWLAIALRGRRLHVPAPERRWVRGGFAAAAFLSLYILVAGLPVVYGHKLFESMSMVDLVVRVPLVDMAAQHGQPVVNPFDNLYGHTTPLRYYYYWSVLGGLVGRLLHLPPRAAQTASGIWAMLMVLCSGFLLLSSVFRPRAGAWSVRRLCLLTLPVGCIVGLDLPWLMAFFLRKPRVLYPDSDYWRSASDFSPSFNLGMLYAPHHFAGLAICFFTFLLICPPQRTGLLPADGKESAVARVSRAVFAALGLAMMLGTSTYMGMFACIAGLFLLIERVRARDWTSTRIILGAATLGFALAAPFLYQALHVSAHAQLAETHQATFRFSLHAWKLANLLGSTVHDPGHGARHIVIALARAVLWCALLVTELGFFGFVLWIRARDDWRNRHCLEARQRFQWLLFLAIALPGFFLSTAALAGDNDLSRHAGLALRLLAVLWATPIVAEYLASRVRRRQVAHSWAGRVALAFVAVGLVTQLYQVLGQRFYNVISDHVAIALHSQWHKIPNQAAFNYQVFQAYRALDQAHLPSGSVLYNPSHRDSGVSTLQLYQTRFAVAGEKHCMTAFGGDIAQCLQALPPVYALFGDHAMQRIDQQTQPDPLVTGPILVDTAADMGLAAMQSLCLQHHAVAVLATNTDGAWKQPGSFIWTAPVLYAADQVRLLACPVNPAVARHL